MAWPPQTVKTQGIPPAVLPPISLLPLPPLPRWHMSRITPQPFFASRAASSSLSSFVFLGAFIRYHLVDSGTCCTTDELPHGPLPVPGVLIDPLQGVQLTDPHSVIDLRAVANIVS
jgi:hypothetical protein